MATAVLVAPKSGDKASLQTAPCLKVDRDSRRYQCAIIGPHASTVWTRASSSAVRNSGGGSASVTKICIDVSGQI
jgi:hypothetical protein